MGKRRDRGKSDISSREREKERNLEGKKKKERGQLSSKAIEKINNEISVSGGRLITRYS